MSNEIERFRFDILPWTYVQGVKTLRVTVEFNGTHYAEVEIMSDAEPWESQLEYFVRRAVDALSLSMKQASEDKGQLTSVPPVLRGFR